VIEHCRDSRCHAIDSRVTLAFLLKLNTYVFHDGDVDAITRKRETLVSGEMAAVDDRRLAP
jgi:hypothetical protein